MLGRIGGKYAADVSPDEAHFDVLSLIRRTILRTVYARNGKGYGIGLGCWN
jgi:hypothetical protein